LSLHDALPILGPGGAALGAEPPAAVRRGVQVDVAAAGVGAHPEACAAVLAEPRGQPPDRAGEVGGADRVAAAGHVEVPTAGVVCRDARLDREGLQQGVELGDGVGAAPRCAVLEDAAQALLGPTEDREFAVSERIACRVPGLGGLVEECLEVVEGVQRGIDELDGDPRVRIDVHAAHRRRFTVRRRDSRFSLCAHVPPARVDARCERYARLMLRSVILVAAQSSSVERFVATAPLSRIVVRRFVPGTTTGDVLRAARDLTAGGLRVTIEHLGEDTVLPEQAEEVRDTYLDLISALAAAELATGADLSLKLSALGQRFDEDMAYDYARAICR